MKEADRDGDGDFNLILKLVIGRQQFSSQQEQKEASKNQSLLLQHTTHSCYYFIN
jgi:hypothetical protein